MKIGDLIYNGEKISDMSSKCSYNSDLDCKNCKYISYNGTICELIDCADVEVELPPIIKAADVAKDAINPAHYKTGKYECIDVMIETLGIDFVKGFCIGNAFKYLYRFRHKNGVEDVKKAKWYIDKFVELEGGNDRL